MADGPRDTGVSAVGAGRRMAQAAMALGALAVIGGLLVGWLGYRASLAKIELAYQAKYLDECRLLATVAREASEAHGDDDVVLAEIEAAWREDTDSAPDEYVCIVDSHSDLILHTAHPEAIGKYAGENPIVCDPDCEFVGETLAELVDLGAEHVGGYVSSAGQKQIAAFAPVPGRGWVIGVHRSDAALRSEARAGLWPAMLGYVLVCGLLIPLALGLMYQTFNRTLREREKATAELAKSAWLLGEIHDAVIGTGPAPEYPITSWNRGAGWVYGWAADEVMGKPIGEVLLTEYPNDSEREPGDGAATGEFWGHVTQAHKDGRRLTIDAHVEATRGEHGEITGWLAVNRDMTDRVEAQAALEASEERFERTLDLVPVGVGTADADGIVLTTNRRICKILGYAADELIGIHIGDLYVNADDRARVQAALVGHQAAGGIEVNLKHKDGTPVPVELHVVVVDVGGQTTRIAAIHDLTERKKADRALRESQARLAEAQRIGGIGNWSVDLKTRLVTWYEQAYRLFGLDYSADPLTQADFMAFVHPDDHHIIAEMNEAVIESDGPLVIEYRITRADGQMRWIREHVECERAHDGTPERLVGTVQDVTDERRLQDAIRGIIEGAAAATGDEFFNAMTSQLAEAIGADFTIIGEMADDTNEAVRTLSVCADGEVADNFEYDLAGTPCANVIGRDACVYEEGVADEFPEDHLLREMGVEGYVGVPLFDSQRRPNGIMAALYQGPVVDAALATTILQVFATRTAAELERRAGEIQRHGLEEDLLRAHKLESLGVLAGGIAHDFNNVLVAILGYNELALNATRPDDPIRADLENVRQASERARDLVQHILTFSRQAESDREPVSMPDLVWETLQFIRATLPSTIGIEEEIDAECPPVLADPTQIHQIIMNLCANAQHAMRDGGGTLRVRLSSRPRGQVKCEGARELEGDRFTCLRVEDTGCGMDAETLGRIFEPYFTTKGVGEGTGMGMSTVHGIVSSYGGAVSVESEVGVGTTIRICLPAHEGEPDRPTPTVSTEGAVGGTERVLLVDDEETLVMVATRMLTSLGYEVTARADSGEALALFESDPDQFDLVVTDQTMPDLTGLELVERMRRIRADIPIIMATGFSPEVDEKNLDALGVDELVMKPYDRQSLAEIVRRVLDGRG